MISRWKTAPVQLPLNHHFPLALQTGQLVSDLECAGSEEMGLNGY